MWRDDEEATSAREKTDVEKDGRMEAWEQGGVLCGTRVSEPYMATFWTLATPPPSFFVCGKRDIQTDQRNDTEPHWMDNTSRPHNRDGCKRFEGPLLEVP